MSDSIKTLNSLPDKQKIKNLRFALHHICTLVCSSQDDIERLTTECDALAKQNIGLIAQHHRDSVELRKLCQERDKLRDIKKGKHAVPIVS